VLLGGAGLLLVAAICAYFRLGLVLSVLIWRMIRAAETKSGRDFTIVAALIGIAWAAHPSATTLGAAFLLFVVAHHRVLGVKGIAWRTGVAAACAIGPSLLLPVLAMRRPEMMLGDPTTVRSAGPRSSIWRACCHRTSGTSSGR
jgi:hypothetical protein